MSLIKTLGPDGWEVEGIDEPLVRYDTDANGNVTGLLDPQGNKIGLIKTDIVAVTAAAFSVATGLGTTTGIDLNAVTLDTDGTLADLINNRINVPTDATHCRVHANGYFAANATGSRIISFEQHISDIVWVATASDQKPSSGAGFQTYFSFVYPLTTVNAASASHVRLAVAQDSGGNLNFTLNSATFEFLKVV